MDITQARKLSKIITTYSSTSYSNVVETLIPEKPLSGFHQWADGKPFEGGFLVTSSIARLRAIYHLLDYKHNVVL